MRAASRHARVGRQRSGGGWRAWGFGLALALGVVTSAPAQQTSSPQAAAPQTSLEDYAKMLLSGDELAVGDMDAAVGNMLDALEREPSHPLADAAVELVAAMLGDVSDPGAVDARIQALAGATPGVPLSEALTRPARFRLRELAAERAAVLSPVEALHGDLFPDRPRRWQVLGPLARGAGPGAGHLLVREVAELGFAGPGPLGPVELRKVRRHPLRASLSPSDVVRPSAGRALMRTDYLSRSAGGAWLEIDTGRNPHSYAFRVNEEEAVWVDRLRLPMSPRQLHPVMLRKGDNAFVFGVDLDIRGLDLRVRLMTPAGETLRWSHNIEKKIRKGEDIPELGDPATMTAPREARSVLAALEGDPARGPYALALAGVLDIRNNLHHEGVAKLEQASTLLPDDNGVRMHLALGIQEAWHLPDVWRRGRARELAEAILADDPDHLSAGLFVAEILASEDREEEAIALLQRERPADGGWGREAHWRRRLGLASVYRRMDMDFEAEETIKRAFEEAPDAADVIAAFAAVHEGNGRPSWTAQAHEQLMALHGRTASRLSNLSRRWLQLGDIERAQDLMRESITRHGTGERTLAGLLLELGKYDEARAQLAVLAQRHPAWADPWALRADVARLALDGFGDAAAETSALREALARAPSRRDLRDRLAAAGDDESLAARYGLDSDDVLAAYDSDRDRWNESVVRVLDEGVVEVFSDGAFETVTHDIYHLRDLDACERLGTQQLQGDVLAVRTIKGDGSGVYEPVRTGNYVMPLLQPGDFVETITRRFSPAPRDGVVRLGRWNFASSNEPFSVSRYVVSLPKALELRLVEHSLDGKRLPGAPVVSHEVIDAGDRWVHVYEARDVSRVRVDPYSPPPEWYLPGVEFGNDQSMASVVDELRSRVATVRWLTNELRTAAQAASADAQGHEAQARALYAFVNAGLDQRFPFPSPAAHALLMREGNGTVFFASLLEAVGIPHDVVWARRFEPSVDPEPDPSFVTADYWAGKLLVRVRPDDGPAVWCDLSPRQAKYLPYGTVLDESPGAPALVVDTGEFLTLPTMEMTERSGGRYTADWTIARTGDARGEIEVGWTGPTAFLPKETFNEVPAAQRPWMASGMTAQVAPAMDVEDFEFVGLDDPDAPVSLRVSGPLPRLLDADGACALPLPAMDLAARFAGEGTRHLDFRLGQPFLIATRTRLRLEPGLTLIEHPQSVEIALQGGGTYTLAVTSETPDGPSPEPSADPRVEPSSASGGRASDGRAGGTEWVIRRELILPAGIIAAADFERFAAECGRIDELERGRLRFAGMVRAAGSDEEEEPTPLLRPIAPDR